MAIRKLNGKDLLLLLLYVPGHRGQFMEPIRGRTRLTKMVFLFEKEIYKPFRFDQIIPEEALPKFIPYHFGPFSADLYTDLHFLIKIGLIISTDIDGSEPVDPGSAFEYKKWKFIEGIDDGIDEDEYNSPELETYTEQEFQLSDKGKLFVEEKLLPQLSKNQLDILQRFKMNWTAGSLQTILEYVYKTYDSMTEKSLIKEKILGYGDNGV